MDCHADHQPGSPARCRGAETARCTRGLVWERASRGADGCERAGLFAESFRGWDDPCSVVGGWGWGSIRGTALSGTLLLREGLCSNLEPAVQFSVSPDRTPSGPPQGVRGSPRGALWVKGPCNL